MSQFIFKMPDLGEGTVEAEIVAGVAGAALLEDLAQMTITTGTLLAAHAAGLVPKKELMIGYIHDRAQ